MEKHFKAADHPVKKAYALPRRRGAGAERSRDACRIPA